MADGAAACTGNVIALEANVPNLDFVLDASGSMRELSKWTNVRSVVAKLIADLGPQARFGAAAFPAPAGVQADACSVGAEVMPLQLGDTGGLAASRFLAATSFQPEGGTPTASTFEMLTPELAGFSGVTYAIVATDGGPNCNPALSCGVDWCTSNIDGVPGCPLGGPPNCCLPTRGGGTGCMDDARASQAVSALRAAGVRTFVIGIPGSAPYSSVLDDIATRGGTARSSEPFYYRVDTADAAALATALGEIAAQAMNDCSLRLRRAPGTPSSVNVTLGEAVVARDGPDGWTLRGTELTLLGSACQRLRAVGASSVRIVEGCPTGAH